MKSALILTYAEYQQTPEPRSGEGKHLSLNRKDLIMNWKTMKHMTQEQMEARFLELDELFEHTPEQAKEYKRLENALLEDFDSENVYRLPGIARSISEDKK